MPSQESWKAILPHYEEPQVNTMLPLPLVKDNMHKEDRHMKQDSSVDHRGSPSLAPQDQPSHNEATSTPNDPPAGVSRKTSKKHPVDLPGLDDAIPSRVHYLTKQRTKMYKIIKEMHTSMCRLYS